MLPRVIIIGTGNVFSHLTPALLKSLTVEILQIVGRNKSAASNILVDNMNLYIEDLSEIKPEVDYVFLLVNDASIATLTRKLKNHLSPDTCIVHFSGATDLSTIDPYFIRPACAWPIGSISSEDESLELTRIPICISTSSKKVYDALEKIFNPIFKDIIHVTEHQKLALHTAAVMVNNFSNHQATLAEKLLNAQGLDLKLLRPIIKQTAAKLQANSPREMQTGPAVRGDEETIAKHLDFLADEVMISQIYKMMTHSITKLHKK